MKKLELNGKIININISENEDDYISLTDMVQFRPESLPSSVISHWLSNRNTLIYVGIWEKVHNPDFNSTEFRGIEIKAGINGFSISPVQLVKRQHGQ